MTPLFKKLNLGAHKEIIIINATDGFESEVAALEGVSVRRSASELTTITFLLAFVQTLAEVETIASTLRSAPSGDVVIWFAYPKGSSKRYRCEFNRDTGWAAVREAGFDSVRQVAIDEDWTALRFRRIEYIKSQTVTSG